MLCALLASRAEESISDRVRAVTAHIRMHLMLSCMVLVDRSALARRALRDQAESVLVEGQRVVAVG